MFIDFAQPRGIVGVNNRSGYDRDQDDSGKERQEFSVFRCHKKVLVSCGLYAFSLSDSAGIVDNFIALLCKEGTDAHGSQPGYKTQPVLFNV